MAKRLFGSRAAEPRGPSYTTSTPTLQVSEDIMPIAELKARISEVVRGLDDRPRPLVITLNGKSAAVLMSPRAYDRLSYHARVAEKIERGAADGRAGRTLSDQELSRRVAKRYRTARSKQGA